MSDYQGFTHERLDVYQRAVRFDTRAAVIIENRVGSCEVVDHLDRAAESIVENIVSGNSRRSEDAKCRYFGIAYGSALECAASLDVGLRRQVFSSEDCQLGKEELGHIVRMLVGLIRSYQRRLEAREPKEPYDADNIADDAEHRFDHEHLEVYRYSLDFVGWADVLLRTGHITTRFAKRLDSLSTSTVLNIAEGNGRFGRRDHRSFIDTAYRSTLKSASLLDRMLAREIIGPNVQSEGKRALARIARMLSGLRDYLDDT